MFKMCDSKAVKDMKCNFILSHMYYDLNDALFLKGAIFVLLAS